MQGSDGVIASEPISLERRGAGLRVWEPISLEGRGADFKNLGANLTRWTRCKAYMQECQMQSVDCSV